MVSALIALVGVPALASGQGSAPAPGIDAQVEAFDFGFHEVGQPETDNVVNIPLGGTVEFSYPDGGSVHNVVFDQEGPSCQQTEASSGFPLSSGPPLPENAQPAS